MAETEPYPTFLFADLAGFTALTEAHGDEEAAELAADFAEQTRALLASHAASAIKGLGDAMMIRVGAPEQAVLLGLRIVHEIGRQGRHAAVIAARPAVLDGNILAFDIAEGAKALPKCVRIGGVGIG